MNAKNSLESATPLEKTQKTFGQDPQQEAKPKAMRN